MTASVTQQALHSPSELQRIQRRTIVVLSAATILGGLGVGASLSVGALLLAEVSGNEAISGLASAVFGAGAAAAGVPLSRIAMRHGRRRALVTGSLVALAGALLAIVGAAIMVWPVLALGLAMLGVASTVQLLSRFTATDLAAPKRRARDLSLVVWMITVGAVVGPNLIVPGEAVGRALGLTPLAGVFVFAVFAQLAAALVNWFGLRPDPLITARELATHEAAATSDAAHADGAAGAGSGTDAPKQSAPATGRISVPRTHTRLAQWLTITVIAMAQILMVGIMAMTPLHLMHTGGSAETVGLTLSLHIAGMYALSPVFGWSANKLGRMQTIAIGMVFFAASIVLAYISGDSHITVQVALVLLGVGWSAVTVSGAVLLTDITPESERPKWQGLADTFMSASGAVAGALAGVAFAIGDFTLLNLIAGIVLALGTLVALKLALTASRGGRSHQ